MEIERLPVNVYGLPNGGIVIRQADPQIESYLRGGYILTHGYGGRVIPLRDDTADLIFWVLVWAESPGLQDLTLADFLEEHLK